MPPKAADPYYASKDHIEWAIAVKRRANYECERCGKAHGRMYADHIKELKGGGLPLAMSNGQCVCARCHTRKTVADRRNGLMK